jgi:hypothetical protein
MEMCVSLRSEIVFYLVKTAAEFSGPEVTIDSFRLWQPCKCIEQVERLVGKSQPEQFGGSAPKNSNLGNIARNLADGNRRGVQLVCLDWSEQHLSLTFDLPDLPHNASPGGITKICQPVMQTPEEIVYSSLSASNHFNFSHRLLFCSKGKDSA